MNILNLSKYLYECGKVIAENAFSPKHEYVSPCTSLNNLLEIDNNEIAFIWSDNDFVTPLHNGLMAYYVYMCLLGGGGGANMRFYLLHGGDHNSVYLNGGKNVFVALSQCLSGAGEKAIDIDKQLKDACVQKFADKTKYMFDICYGYTSLERTAKSINTMYNKVFDCLAAISPQSNTHIDIYSVDDDANIIPKSIDVKDYVYE